MGSVKQTFIGCEEVQNYKPALSVNSRFKILVFLHSFRILELNKVRLTD